MNKILALLIMTTAATFAADGRFLNLIAGFSAPMGDYALQSDDPNAGFAKVGFAGGLEYDWFIKRGNLAWSTAFHYIANDFESNTFSRGVSLDLYESGTYSAYTLVTGLKWQKNLAESVEVFALGQAGFGSIKGPFLSGYPSTGSGGLIEFQMNSSSGFAFAVGAGMLLNRQTYLAVRYIDAGKATFSKKISAAGNPEVNWSTPVSMLLITVGYAIAFDE